MKFRTQLVLTFFLAVAAGFAFYLLMEDSIPDESKCSYGITVWADVIAVIVGTGLIAISIQYKDIRIAFPGLVIAVEHVLQAMYANKGDFAKTANLKGHLLTIFSAGLLVFYIYSSFPET